MPTTELTLCDGTIDVDYEIKNGERGRRKAEFLEAYIKGGALDCTRLFISDDRGQSFIRLDEVLQNALNEKVSGQPDLLEI